MFKKILVGLFLLAGSQAYAVELKDASNQQILDELSFRLRAGGGSSSTSFSISATCDNSYLEINVYNNSFVNTGSIERYAGSNDDCKVKAKLYPFGANGRIQSGEKIAICDNSYLQVYGVMTDGTLKAISNTYQGSSEACWQAVQSFISQNL